MVDRMLCCFFLLCLINADWAVPVHHCHGVMIMNMGLSARPAITNYMLQRVFPEGYSSNILHLPSMYNLDVAGEGETK